MYRLRVPTINDSEADFILLIDLLRQAINAEDDVTVDFSSCRFIRQNGVAFLGGLAHLVLAEGYSVDFDDKSLRYEVRANLTKNGFLAAFGLAAPSSIGNTISYRRDTNRNGDQLVHYLERDWLGRGWVNLSSGLSKVIVGTVWEVYDNAFEHSRSRIGVFSCGQHYPTLKKLRITVIDFGIGIVENIRTFFENPSIRPGSALKWAFESGTTTLDEQGISRGVGLDILKEFVQVNRGSIQLISNDGYGLITARQETYRTLGTGGRLEANFEGTIINIALNCNEQLYALASEFDDDPLF